METKQRHGCLTAFLIVMILANAFTSLLYLFAGEMIRENFPGHISKSMLLVLGLLGLANIAFTFLIFKWKKIGFWGFVLSGIAALIINLSIGLGIGQSLLGLVGIGILYGLLQIKQNNVSGWNQLE